MKLLFQLSVLAMLFALGRCVVPEEVTNEYQFKTSGLTERKWKLTEVFGRSAPFHESYQIEPYLILDSAATGRGACNTFFAKYEVKDTSRITFSPLGATKMYCTGIEIEQQFFKALEETQSYVLTDNDHLIFKNAEMVVVAKFKTAD